MSVHDETPAETIRRAIEQMRADASAATAGAWIAARGYVLSKPEHGIREAVADVYPTGGSERQLATARHIAAWGPDRALATADLLEGIADGHARILAMFPPDLLPSNVTAVYGFDAALRLARTYLGETP